MELKKIVILGPESTGKSTLCEQLAAHYKSIWVPEYAREYLEKNGTEYTYDDLLIISKAQIEKEDKYVEQAIPEYQRNQSNSVPFIFIDTDMHVMKVWCEFVFNKCHNWILNQVASRQYDAYLLCDTDLPWVADALREYPDKKIREKLYHYYKDLMIHQSTPWSQISGNYEERFHMAVQFIDRL